MYELSFISLLALCMVSFIGVPHGSFDGAVAALLGYKTRKDFLIFVILYLIISASVIVFWIYFPVVALFIFIFMRNKSLSKELVAVVLICFLILLNPYLKPYHFIFFTPLLLLIKDSYLTNTRSMLFSIAYPSFFWIVASNLSVGTLTGYFQTVFFALFVFNLVKLDLDRND